MTRQAGRSCFRIRECGRIRACVGVALACIALLCRPASGQTAHDEYDRLALILFELDKSDKSPFSGDRFSDTQYIEKGVIDDHMQHWLDAVRPLVPDIIRATGLSYGRAKVPERPTGSSPNVFQRHRRLVRALEIFVIDARRRDPSQVLTLLQAQLKLAERTAEEGGLIALLVANSQSTVSHETISAMVMQGEIDRDMATALVADTESIADVEKLGLWRFVEADFEELGRRLATLRAADASQRAAVARSLGLFNGDDDAYAGLKHRPLSDDALQEAILRLPRYREEIKAIRRLTDASRFEAAVDDLSKAVERGEFGGYFVHFPPLIESVIKRLRRDERAWSALRADLLLLAEDRATPRQLADGTEFFLRAATVAESLSIAEQTDIETFRLAFDHVSPEVSARTREALARYRQTIVQQLLEGSMRGRARAEPEYRVRKDRDADGMFVGLLQPGINGAVRVMLASALASATSTDRDKPEAGGDDAPAPQQIAVATVRIAATLADTGNHGHSLAAVAMLGDALLAIRQLDSLGALDQAGRAELGEALKGFLDGDPLGFARATKAARRALVQKDRWADRRQFRDPALVESLSPQELIAVLTIAAKPASFLVSDCDCLANGPLLDMRGWFHGDALARASAARIKLLEREAQAKLGEGGDDKYGDKRIPGAPLADLSVEPPFDLAEKAAAGEALLTRLHEIAKKPAAAAK
jgi:hypothetical protein